MRSLAYFQACTVDSTVGTDSVIRSIWYHNLLVRTSKPNGIQLEFAGVSAEKHILRDKSYMEKEWYRLVC